MAAKRDDTKDLEVTKRLMGALLRQKPKPHDEMKVGKRSQKKVPPKLKATKPKKELRK